MRSRPRSLVNYTRIIFFRLSIFIINLQRGRTDDSIFHFTSLNYEISLNWYSLQPNLHLESVTEADAGTYVCRISNSWAAIEARAVLRVIGVVPMFDGESWLALPTLKDAFRQFDIEISFKPTGKIYTGDLDTMTFP